MLFSGKSYYFFKYVLNANTEIESGLVSITTCLFIRVNRKPYRSLLELFVKRNFSMKSSNHNLKIYILHYLRYKAEMVREAIEIERQGELNKPLSSAEGCYIKSSEMDQYRTTTDMLCNKR